MVTCFFLDTAHNALDYIECIHAILKPGGLWVNFGPLLYHYADQHDQPQLEFSWETLEKLIPKMGFEFLTKETKETSYTQNRTSLMQMRYMCKFFSTRKLNLKS